ncbi:hypothetical protein F5B22DRAFT_455808 [Xylaria bambusicola]|uniref:uncharacterized protein n=1 Tax=Xylaria bambusicola TaxID=326684 RepID=UPI0020078AFE|nr:uncharacterized protein F5B22DRAFT_455808 [Xylaria bambusicola]KAI0506317.1 hypothetical protein F5B22DRAFT_455808 [Xylaria bambusicola]
MDPLSVTASVAGLLTAAHEVIKLLKPYVSAARETPGIIAHVRDETESTRIVLVGLQSIVQGIPGRVTPGGALVGVDQVVIILTSGVLLFAELEGAVRGLVAAPPSLRNNENSSNAALSPTQYRLPLRARLQWGHREQALGPLLTRLQGFKVSVTAVLMLLQSDSNRRAEHLQTELAINIGALLDSNHDLSRRMMRLENPSYVPTSRSQSRRSNMSNATVTRLGSIAAASASSGQRAVSSEVAAEQTGTANAVTAPLTPPSETTLSVSKPNSRSVFEFESDLEASPVYRRVKRDTMDFSFRSSVARTHAWSIFSGRSLADVSVLSVIALPLDVEEVTNKHHYINTCGQQMTPVVEGITNTPKPKSLRGEEQFIFRDCYMIYSQLIQIPGFPELFETEWQAQQVANDEGAVAMDQSGQSPAPQLNMFRALKSIFQTDAPYRLLSGELGWNLDDELQSYSNQSSDQVAKKAYSLFLQLCMNSGIEIGDLPCAVESPRFTNSGFLRVLACVSKSLNDLIGSGVICPLDVYDLDALLSRESSLCLPQEWAGQHQHSFFKLVDSQRSFVQDLLSLIDALEKLALYHPLLLSDHPHISPLFFSCYADSEIELLLAVERMMLLPPREHFWASLIRRWSVTAETLGSLMITNNRKVGTVLQEVIREKRNILTFQPDDEELLQKELKLITSCTESLSSLSRIFPLIAQTFRDILDAPSGDLAETEMIDSAQQKDFAEGRRLVDHTLRVMNGMIRQTELEDELGDILRCLKDCRSERFGHLIRTDNLHVTPSYSVRAEKYYVYLFEKNLLLLTGLEYDSEEGQESPVLGKQHWIAHDPTNIQLNGMIYFADIMNVELLGNYGVYIWWRSGDSNENILLSFTSEQQTMQWYESLKTLERKYHTPSVMQRRSDVHSFVSLQPAHQCENLHAGEGDDDDEPGCEDSMSKDDSETASQFFPHHLQSSKPTSDLMQLSAGTQSLLTPPLTPPPRLQDRPLLYSRSPHQTGSKTSLTSGWSRRRYAVHPSMGLAGN